MARDLELDDGAARDVVERPSLHFGCATKSFE